MVRVGDVVHYVLETGPYVGQHRPAIVVRKWASDLVNLQVFTDSGSDQRSNDQLPPVYWRTSIKENDAHLNGTWHLIEDHE